VDLPAVKLALRPGFHVELLADEGARKALVEALAWFRRTALKDVAPAARA
jgi:hypothetical protein